MEDELKLIRERALTSIESAGSIKEIDEIKIKFLGRKGLVAALMEKLPQVAPSERPRIGKLVNDCKNEIAALIQQKAESFNAREMEKHILSQKLDVTLPSSGLRLGHLHPITQLMNEIVGIFSQMGFSIAEGPDVEDDYYNFQALNFPPNHPAREMQDTFYLKNGYLLRTHTSPVQIREMQKQKPPLAIVIPGRVYRCDSDVTHSPVFHQLEGLLVDKDVTFADLKGTLAYFLHCVFGKQRKVRFRPSFFPFTEPSAEVDVECIICNGEGCRVCSGTGWLEILGAGMVDPNVFKHVKYDSEKYSGFAFGMGIERIAMLKHGIDDIRHFFRNDLRFLRQF